MVATAASLIVSVRFHKVGKLYHFDASAYPHLLAGDYVIVDTTRGRQIGQIMGIVPPDKAEKGNLKPIKAPATARDLMMKKWWEARELEALIHCRETLVEIGGLGGVKFVRATYSYDGSMLVLVFTSEEETVNTNRLRKRLEQDLHTRIEMRRIGARDAARLLGEYGACSELRCCATHLTDFSPVSIKMAKAQGISLNPSEITGMCGRLRCCLVYEYEQYVEALHTLPKVGKWIGTPFGEGKVAEVNPLKGMVTVYVEDTRHEVKQEDLVPAEEMRAFAAKAAQPCHREGATGPCEGRMRMQASVPLPPEARQAASSEPEAPSEKKSSHHRRRHSRRRRSSGGGTQAS